MLRNEFFANQKFVMNKVRKEGRRKSKVEWQQEAEMVLESKVNERSLDWYIEYPTRVVFFALLPSLFCLFFFFFVCLNA